MDFLIHAFGDEGPWDKRGLVYGLRQGGNIIGNKLEGLLNNRPAVLSDILKAVSIS